MNKRKLILLTSISFAAACSAYLLISAPRTYVQEQKILQCVCNGNAVSAEAILSKIPANKLPLPHAFYKGCIAQLRGKLAESHLYFQSALKSTRENLLLNVAFAEMANGFLEHKENEWISHLETAHKLAETHPLFAFFDGLSFYCQGEYEKASSAWKTFNCEDLPHSGAWGSSVFESLFPKSLRQLYLAHCLIETGDYLKGREMLEKESRFLLGDEKLLDLSPLFLGLSYLQESKFLPIQSRGSYYQLSLFYFEKSRRRQSQFERSKIAEKLVHEVEFLAAQNLEQEQKKWIVDFVFLLQTWQEDKDVDHRLSSILTNRILEGKDAALYELLLEKFYATPLHCQMKKDLLASLSVQLREKKDLSQTFETADRLSYLDKELAKEIAALSREAIYEAVNQDDRSLCRTCQFVRFLDKFHKGPEKKSFGLELVHLSKLFWHTEGQEDKGLSLMELAASLEEEAKNEIASFLTNLYYQAENSNMIRRLAFIYEALEHFGLSQKELATPSKIANYLADAEYLYYAKNFSSAKIQANWVLKLDPHNEEALRLVGLSAFHLGEYSQAHLALSQLSNPDEYACKALILSQAYSFENGDQHLVQIDSSDTFDQDE